MSRIHSSPRRARGLSLIELMVAITIGLILMAGAISIFISNKETYEITDDLSRLQENARFALDYMSRDLRMAGYFGCVDDVTRVSNHVDASAGSLMDTDIPVEGIERGSSATTWQPSGVAEPAGIVAGTDGITVRYLDPLNDLTIDTPFMPTTSAALHVTAPNNVLKKGDIVAVTDCNSTDVFQITSQNPDSNGTVGHNTGTAGISPGNATKDLSKTYTGDASIARLIAVRYYVGTGTNGPALFRELISNNNGAVTTAGQEFIGGVESLQILYGEDTTGDRIPNTYVTAAAVGDWEDVVSTRIGLLLRTIDEYGSQVDSNTYAVNGTAVDPTDDRRRRRVFGTTVLMRNLQ